MPASAYDFKVPLIPVTKDFKLANGMRCILSEDHSVPVAALAIVYDVGARDEQKGRSGFAHLFEHMMFEGSDNVGKNEFFKYVEGAGGSLNASTHPDFTNYFEKLPSNQIELALWLESDRMRSLKITDENFQNQLQTVKEEKRMRIDNQPYTPSAIRFEEIMYDNWANAHPVIGSFEDLEASSTADVKQFFKTYYAPNNAVLAIVGDIDSEKMAKLIEKYFGTITPQPKPSRPDVSESVQTKAKYEKMDDAQAKLPAFWIGWKAPARRDPDYYPLAVIEKLLGAGESSRLYQRMIKGEQVALKVDSGIDTRRGPEAFEAFVVVKPGSTPEKVRQILFAELEKLKTTQVTEAELEKSRNQILRDLFSSGSYSSLQRSLGRAEMLAEYTSFWGDPSVIDKDLEAFMKATPADIQRVAAKVFTEGNSTVIDINPVAPKSGDKASSGGKSTVATNSKSKSETK